MKDFIYIISYVVIAVALILITRWMFNTVMTANIPDWVKYMILR